MNVESCRLFWLICMFCFFICLLVIVFGQIIWVSRQIRLESTKVLAQVQFVYHCCSFSSSSLTVFSIFIFTWFQWLYSFSIVMFTRVLEWQKKRWNMLLHHIYWIYRMIFPMLAFNLTAISAERNLIQMNVINIFI